MNWDEVNNILYNGTQEQIDNVICPECGGELELSYFPTIRSVEILCNSCGTFIRQNGTMRKPNFAKTPVKTASISST